MEIKKANEQILQDAKLNKIIALNNNCKKQLEKTDWYVIKNLENGEAIPAEITNQRVALRTKCNEKETEINSLKNDFDVINFNIEF